MVLRMLKYGQYPVNGSNIRYVALNEREQDFISLLYLQILWTQDMTETGRYLPTPIGTGMELWFMLQISIGKLFLWSATRSMDLRVAENLLFTLFQPKLTELVPDTGAFLRKLSLISYNDHVNHFKRLLLFMMSPRVEEYSNEMKRAIADLCSPADRFPYKAQSSSGELLCMDYIQDRDSGIWRLGRVFAGPPSSAHDYYDNSDEEDDYDNTRLAAREENYLPSSVLNLHSF